MQIILHAGGIRLNDPGDCRRFNVVDDGSVPLDAALRAAGAGYAHGVGAMIDVSWLRGQAHDQVDANWPADFAAMLRYAAAKGWLSADRSHVRAHVEAA
jgi:hypothetical protein